MKRAIALFLALVFVFTLIPVSALAIEPTNPTIQFTIGFKEKKIVNGVETEVALTGGSTFTREYDATSGALLGATEETVTLPSVKKVVKDIEFKSTGWTVPLTVSSIVEGKVKLDLSAVPSVNPANPQNITATIILSYKDPTVTFGADILSVTYPGKVSGVATGESIPVGTTVTVTAADRSADKLYLASLQYGDKKVAFNADRVATFTMPDENVTLTPIYEIDLVLKTSLGTVLDTQRVGITAKGELAATEPIDEILDVTSITPGARVDSATFDAATNSVKYELKDTGALDLPDSAVIEIKATQLYKLNLEDCEIEIVRNAGGDELKRGVGYKVSGADAYLPEGAAVMLRATEEATSYKWMCNNVDAPEADGKSRTVTITMPKAETTWSVTAVHQYKVIQYDANGANPVESWHIPGASVTATAKEPANASGFKFARWSIAGIGTEVAAGDLTKNPITFRMPSSEVTLTPVYFTTLKLTNASVTFADLPTGTNATKYKTETINGNTVDSWYVPSGTKVTITPVAPATGDGTFTFSKWNSNSTRIYGQNTTRVLTFTMPPEDIEASVGWASYTLTVRRYVNSGAAETYTLRPGEYATFDAQVATGGTAFSYWSYTTGVGLKVTDTDQKNEEGKFTNSRITVQMGTANAEVRAVYAPSNSLSYLYTGAHIEMISEPVRYYALAEYFSKSSLQVKYYPNLGEANGVTVDNSQLVCRVIDPTTKETVTADDGAFNKTGDFALEITFYVNGVKMADTITVLNTPSTYIHVYTNLESVVASYAPYNKLNKSLYYSGETTDKIDKDGLVISLVYTDHVTEGIRYFTARALNADEYDLIVYNPLGKKYTGTEDNKDTDIPSVADIEKAIAAGVAGYKKVDDKYYVQLGVKAFDEKQMDSSGNPLRLGYYPNADDSVWIEVQDTTATVLNLTDFQKNKVAITPGAGQEVQQKTDTWPSYSWELDYSEIATGRTFVLETTNGLIGSVAITNEDSKVAGITLAASDEDKGANTGAYTYTLNPRSVGVTKITFYVRGLPLLTTDDQGITTTGAPATMVTLEITVRDDQGAVIKVTDLDSLNKDTATLYVGNKLTLYPAVYSPNNADTTMQWSVTFADDQEPRNAEYYAKVDPVTGVVEALKYTERTIRVYGQAVNFEPASDKSTVLPSGKFPDAAKDVAYCDITIAEIPVYSLTMYPTTLTMYRKATTTVTTKLYPEAATDTKLNWTSSNSNIASVDSEGRITANMVGVATITATANSNSAVYKSCIVTVKEGVLVTELLLSRTSAILGIGESLALSTYYTPATATTQSVTWETSDPSVATVTAAGKIYGMAEGTAVITAVANDGSGCKAACVISVSNIVTSAVVLNKQTLALIEDEEETLVATVYPTNASNLKVNWTSSNPKVAVVDQDGEVTAVGGGSAVITATAKDASAKYADCVVAVTGKIPVTAIALNLGNFDMLLNDTTMLTATITPANATYKLAWTSSDTSVATVDEKGKLSALKTGQAVITCKAGDMTKAITVSVVTKTYSTGKVVNCSRRVNVRASASGTSAIVGYAYLGDVYKVLDRSTNWFKIQYNATTTAYIWSRYLNATETTAGYVSAGKVGSTTTTTTTTTTAAPTVTAKTLTITNCSYCVNVRSGAGTTFSKLGYAYLDENFTYTGVSGDWYMITYNGATAYVSSQFVKVNG